MATDERSTPPRRLPLEGIRVADFTWLIAGPHGAYLLARMGAEVIKIEGYRPLDHTREDPPFADGIPGPNRSGWFASINAGKQSVSLQLDDPEHLQLAREIVAASDVVVENFSYGSMERFGLGYEELRAIKPDLIMVSCSGFGRQGRDRALRAYMGTIHAYTGLNSINGYQGGPPKPVGGTWADYASGTAIVFAVLSALWHRRRTGEGQFVDLAMSDLVVAMLGAPFMDYFLNGHVARPQGSSSSFACPNDVYPCRGDDAWVAISVETDAQWQALVRVVGDPELARQEYADLLGRQRHADALGARLAAWTSVRSALEAAQALQAAGVPSGPSGSAADLLAQPQLQARGFFVAPDHAEVGRRVIPNLPWRLSGWPDLPCPPFPLLGEHNQRVLGGLLGRPPETVARVDAGRDHALAEHDRAAAEGRPAPSQR